MVEMKELNEEELSEVSGGSQRIQGRSIYFYEDLRILANSDGKEMIVYQKESVCTVKYITKGVYQGFNEQDGAKVLGNDGNTYYCKASFNDAPCGAHVFGVVY